MKPDDLNDDLLREILAGHPALEPDDEVKQAHIARALAAFEQQAQKNAQTTQGRKGWDRLTDTINQLRHERSVFRSECYKYGSMIMSVLSVKNRATVAVASIALAALGITTALQLVHFETPPASSGSGSASVGEVLVSEGTLQRITKQEFAESSASHPASPEVAAQRDMTSEMAASPPAPPALTAAPPLAMAPMAKMAAPGVADKSSMGMAEGGMGYAMPYTMPDYLPQPEYQGNDRFEQVAENPVKSVSTDPVSTFSIDVDTASYSFLRRQITQGVMPAPEMVRIEEMINYFDYDYPLPESRNVPFKPTVMLYPTPWNEQTQLLHIGIKGYEIARSEAPRSNLVFLIDTSGSMQGADRLPLLISSLKLLLESLEEDDTVGIVTYAGYSGVALEPTKVKDKAKILGVLNSLGAGGSTAGAEGIETAYQLAAQHFDKEAVNRVVLATDGDFNVGVSDPAQLERLIEKKREAGIFLSVLGFGQGNYNDALMQTLAQNGNGTAAYIDTLGEGRKVLVEEATGALFPIAKDVKIQIEFNPAEVAEYRLIGYETRHLNREDFNNDKVDAGELGAGHTVTAMYEITPVGSKARMMDDLRYAKEQKQAVPAESNGELAFVKLRYKLPAENTSRLLEQSIKAEEALPSIDKASADVRFAAAVAAFGQKLKGSSFTADYGYDRIIALADGARGKDSFGYRAEFINLVRLASSLGIASPVQPQPAPQPAPVPMPAPGVISPDAPVYYETR